MIQAQEISSVLHQMAQLLLNGSWEQWADAYDKLSKKIILEPEETAREILASYGGMGSLNDVVLTKNGNPLNDENIQFDVLRSRLSVLCNRLLSSQN